MAAVNSQMIPLGSRAPAFKLVDTISEQELSLEDCTGEKATVVMFICNHCPYVIHIQAELVAVANDFSSQGIQFLAISSNDAEKYPADAPDKMAATAREHHYPFPYLYDETQQVAKSYQAACTPDFYIFDKDLYLVYRGQFDNSRPGSDIPVTGTDIRNALTCLLTGKQVDQKQQPSLGCSIKWK